MRLALALIIVATTTASAEPPRLREARERPGPMVRFGLTYGVDRNAPEAREVGPMFALGTRAGRIGAELNYTYLSFMDPDSSMHRAGVALRLDLYVHTRPGRALEPARYGAIYGELGAAIRFGEWRPNSLIDRTTSRQDELQFAIGHELEDRWHLALRFGISRQDPLIGASCRTTTGTGCMSVAMDPDAGHIAESVMLESTFALGL